MFLALSTQYQSSLFVRDCISPILTLTNVLNPYDSRWICARTISDSMIKYVSLNAISHSFLIKLLNLAASSAPFNSRQGIVVFFGGDNLDFATRRLLWKLPSWVCHLMYAQAPMRHWTRLMLDLLPLDSAWCNAEMISPPFQIADWWIQSIPLAILQAFNRPSLEPSLY